VALSTTGLFQSKHKDTIQNKDLLAFSLFAFQRFRRIALLQTRENIADDPSSFAPE